MSWVPPDLASACAVYNNLTTCQPATFMFLQLVTNLFGYSRDAQDKFGYDFGSSSFGEFSFYGDYSGHQQEEQYDFIVVGAGSAGCVVANRLSEVKGWKILLLEAGDEEPEIADVPAFAPMLQTSSIDWNYRTLPSKKSCLARDDGRCRWARGKVMGGSSTINYMIYTRGHPKDYDEWAELGNHGWSYDDVLPYFIKSEDNEDPEKVDPYYHGKGGWQTVENFPYQDKVTLGIIKAYEELGLENIDQNSDRMIGTMLLQHTTRHGERLSTNAAFIRPIRRTRKNLQVETNAHVSRILIDPHTKTAIGVEYLQKNRIIKRVRARKEVILSAGSLNSPVILMLSGVGPTDHLQENGIKVIHDLAVGFNLHDHTTIDGVVYSISNQSVTTVDEDQRKQDVYLWKEKHIGPLSSTGPLQSNAFVQTKYEESIDRPDIQYSLDATNVANFITDPALTYNTGVLPLSYYDGLMMRPILLPPKSRGRLLLNHTDPVFGEPLIYANTFDEEIDLLRMVEGIKQNLNLEYTHTFKHMGITLERTPLPACKHYPFGTDEYWACIAMSYTTTIFHPVGTCKMGPKEDITAVVDPKLRVYGIKNLRVIDASIMPKIVRGNTNAPVIMIAEKGSDYIKETWKHEIGDGVHIGKPLYEQSKQEPSAEYSTPSFTSSFDFGDIFDSKFR